MTRCFLASRRVDSFTANSEPSFTIRRNAARHDDARPTARSLSEICGEAVKTTPGLFQARMHRPHQGAVPYGDMAQVQWLKEMRIRRVVSLMRSRLSQSQDPPFIGCGGIRVPHSSCSQ